jgi:hypothetical protein
MMLGEVMALARRASPGVEAWLLAEDPDLGARVSARAEAEAVDVPGFLRIAMADFSRLASDEDWSTMLSRMRGAPDPGRACLLGMIGWALARPAHTHSHPEATDP